MQLVGMYQVFVGVDERGNECSDVTDDLEFPRGVFPFVETGDDAIEPDPDVDMNSSAVTPTVVDRPTRVLSKRGHVSGDSSSGSSFGYCNAGDDISGIHAIGGEPSSSSSDSSAKDTDEFIDDTGLHHSSIRFPGPSIDTGGYWADQMQDEEPLLSRLLAESLSPLKYRSPSCPGLATGAGVHVRLFTSVQVIEAESRVALLPDWCTLPRGHCNGCLRLRPGLLNGTIPCRQFDCPHGKLSCLDCDFEHCSLLWQEWVVNHPSVC